MQCVNVQRVNVQRVDVCRCARLVQRANEQKKSVNF